VSRIIIGDLHGCLGTLKALLEQLPKHIPITFTGDLVDIGPSSPDTIDYFIKNNLESVMGNHDHLVTHVHREAKTSEEAQRIMDDYYFWLDVGGGAKYTPEQIGYLKSLPRTRMYPEERLRGRKLHVSHTFPSDFRAYNNMGMADLLWESSKPEDKMLNNEKLFFVYGHKIVDKPIITDFYAMIDTGCGWKKSQGKLTALQFPEMIITQQECVDSYRY
jgi:hypothetical protein